MKTKDSAPIDAPTFREVRKDVAMHPVARAISRAAAQQSLRGWLTRLYLLEEDEVIATDGVAAAGTLAAAIDAAEMLGGSEHPSIPVMRGAMSALVALSERGFRWHKADAVAIDQGMTRALDLLTTAPARVTQHAYRRLMDREARVDAKQALEASRRSAP